MDGVILPIQKPHHAGNAYYCGRACHSLNVQVVVDRFSVIRWMVTGPTGASHDKSAFEWIRTLLDFLDRLPNPFVMVGDRIYQGIRPDLIVPFRGLLIDAQQRDFSHCLSSVRQVVERAIGALQVN